MKRTRTHSAPSRIAPLSAACVAAALALAVFYHGPQIPLLAGAQFLLVTWLVLSLGPAYATGVRLPLTPLTISLTLFWFWLGISLAWSAVPLTSIINFWWVGSLALAFWCYTLSPDKEQLWFYLARVVFVGALVLCAFALAQFLIWGQSPRATFINVHSFAALIMLIALPASARFVTAWRQRADRALLYGLAISLFVFFFSIAATDGRGTALSTLLAMLALAACAGRLVGPRPLLALGGLLLGAYVAANLLLHGGFTEGRLVTLADPTDAAAPRLLIWRASWDLLLNNPWWGTGLGTYYLAFPPYRDPADQALGYFVHNDYLQIWIEAGLPALLLLLAVFGATLFMFVRLLRHRRAAVPLKLEASGLFCGLLAAAVHSALDFNLYILPISLVAGLALGRLHECVVVALRPPVWWLQPAKLVRGSIYRTGVLLLAFLPMSYFIALGVADYLYKHGFTLIAQGDLPQADRAFIWAERLISFDDKVLTMHADLYRYALTRQPETAPASERRALFEGALAMLAEAESFNPYRPLIHVVRARLVAENHELAGADWQARAENAYRHALTLDPRFIPARIGYAALLMADKRDAQAYRLLEEGMHYWYTPGDPLLDYYEITAQLASRLGKATRALEIQRKLEEVKQVLAAVASTAPPPRPPLLITPAT